MKHKDARETLNAKVETKHKQTAYNQAGLGRAFTVIDGSLRNSVADFEDRG